MFRLFVLIGALATALLTGPLPAHAQSGVKQCGGPRTKIAGGSEARLADWPGQAAIRLHVPSEKLAEYFCGGTAINDRWVITAAHCLHDFIDDLTGTVKGSDGMERTGQLEVVLGAGDLKAVGPDRVYRVERHEIHPAYRRRIIEARKIADAEQRAEALARIAIAHGDDIALLRLARPYAGSVASPMFWGDPPNAGTPVRVAGFGRTEKNQLPKPLTLFARADRRGELLAGSDRLLEAAVAVVARDACLARYEAHGAHIGKAQICAGLADGGRDSCAGDSGGPLIVRDKDGCPQQVALVSWGPEACAVANGFAVYTRLAAYSDWIESQVGPLNRTIASALEDEKSLSPIQFAEAQMQLESLLGPAKGRINITIRGGNRVKLGGKVVFEARSDIAGRLAIIDINASREVTLIYPNQFVADDDLGRITADSAIKVPGPGYPGFTHFEAVEPIGKGHLIALVVPEDFALDRAIVDRKSLTKGWAPRNDPPSYMMRLIRQIEVALGSSRSRAVSSSGGNELERWGYSMVEYEITR